MRKQDLILNLLLILSLFGLGWKFRSDWRKYAAENGPQKLDVHPMSGVSLPAPGATPEYSAIAKQDPFNAERNDVLVDPTAQAKTLGPPPLIYGSFILGDNRFALMSTEGANKPERVPEGGVFDGYTLVKVLPESVILESAAGRNEIMLYNALMRLRRVQAKTASSTSPRPSTTSQVASTVTPSNPSSNSTADLGSQASASSVLTNPRNSPVVTPPPGAQVVDTPFGQIVEKKKP